MSNVAKCIYTFISNFIIRVDDNIQVGNILIIL